MADLHRQNPPDRGHGKRPTHN